MNSKIKEILIDDYKELQSDLISDNDYNSDFLNKIKSKLKSFNKIYNLLIDIISPVYTIGLNRRLNKFLYKDIHNISDKTVINLGSGSSNISDDVLNVDIYKHNNVDFVCDISNLPFKDNSVDAIINIAVLEHVPNPEKVIEEVFRVLKPKGYIFSYVPFIQGFHASPYDFKRFTSEGIKLLHGEFKQTEKINRFYPTSGFLWITQEWLSILLSFGSKKLHLLWTLILMLLTFPIKFLDLILQFHPMGKTISTAFIYIGTKEK